MIAKTGRRKNIGKIQKLAYFVPQSELNPPIYLHPLGV